MAKVSSDTRICRARVSMRFSPADNPLSLSRMDRFRTTSATWYTSPDLSFSTWFLYRRDQLVGIRASFLRRTANTSSTSSSLMTSRRPTSSVLSLGTISVRSP